MMLPDVAERSVHRPVAAALKLEGRRFAFWSRFGHGGACRGQATMGYRSEAAIVKGSVLTIDNHRLLGWFSIENGSVLGFGNSLLNRHSFQVLCARGAGCNFTSQRVLNQRRGIKTVLLAPSPSPWPPASPSPHRAPTCSVAGAESASHIRAPPPPPNPIRRAIPKLPRIPSRRDPAAPRSVPAPSRHACRISTLFSIADRLNHDGMDAGVF